MEIAARSTHTTFSVKTRWTPGQRLPWMHGARGISTGLPAMRALHLKLGRTAHFHRARPCRIVEHRDGPATGGALEAEIPRAGNDVHPWRRAKLAVEGNALGHVASLSATIQAHSTRAHASRSASHAPICGGQRAPEQNVTCKTAGGSPRLPLTSPRQTGHHAREA